jgi:hypothetical protein
MDHGSASNQRLMRSHRAPRTSDRAAVPAGSTRRLSRSTTTGRPSAIRQQPQRIQGNQATNGPIDRVDRLDSSSSSSSSSIKAFIIHGRTQPKYLCRRERRAIDRRSIAAWRPRWTDNGRPGRRIGTWQPPHPAGPIHGAHD